MGLLDDLAQPVTTPTNVVRMVVIMETMTDEERAAVQDALDKIVANLDRPNTYPGYSSSWLSKVLRANGHQISSTAVQRYARSLHERTG